MILRLWIVPLHWLSGKKPLPRSPHLVLAGSGRPRLSLGRTQSAGPVSWVKQR